MLTAERERAKYEKVWAHPEYAEHSPGLQWLDLFWAIAAPDADETLLDAGCGDGQAIREFRRRGLDACGIDLVASDENLMFRGPLWKLVRARCFGNRRWHYGYCCDVMEHIPPEYVMLCLHALAAKTGRVFFSICNEPDVFGPKLLGEPLHLTVKPFAWWKEKMQEAFAEVLEARDLMGTSIFYVRS